MWKWTISKLTNSPTNYSNFYYACTDWLLLITNGCLNSVMDKWIAGNIKSSNFVEYYLSYYESVFNNVDNNDEDYLHEIF